MNLNNPFFLGSCCGDSDRDCGGLWAVEIEQGGLEILLKKEPDV